MYGAKGDGKSDDTQAFLDALALYENGDGKLVSKHRVVFVPGGTYNLNQTLIIRENCCLELSQDTVLNFTQTDSDCIQMRCSATLRGNHALIIVPYEFTAHVIDMDTLDDGTVHANVPPYALSSPQFRRQRFVYDVNIIKAIDFYGRPGLCKSADGGCSGTGIYMSATKDNDTSTTDISFLWGVTMSGIRIAGAFNYGIHAINFDSPTTLEGHYEDDAWNHDMRIEAIIENCEIGIALENCNGAHLAVTFQPDAAENKTTYIKHGIYLKDARFVDLIGSRVWDWKDSTTLVNTQVDGKYPYQHLALYGDCSGLLLDDFITHERYTKDIRPLIYTDTPANFDTMTILQEFSQIPFKSVDNKPYFFDGTANRPLRLKSDKILATETYFIHEATGEYIYTPKHTNLVPNSIDTDGSKYNGSGYRLKVGLDNLGQINTTVTGNTTTGFMPVDGGYHTYRIAGNDIAFDDYGCSIIFYDNNFELLYVYAYNHVYQGPSNDGYYYKGKVTKEDTTLLTWTTAKSHSEKIWTPEVENAAYFRVSVRGLCPELIVTVDEKVEYDATWRGEPQRLDESVYAQNVVLTSSTGKLFKLVANDDKTITAEPFGE